MKASIVFEDCEEGVQFRMETDPPLPDIMKASEVPVSVMVAYMWMEKIQEELKGELRTHAIH